MVEPHGAAAQFGGDRFDPKSADRTPTNAPTADAAGRPLGDRLLLEKTPLRVE